MELIMHTSVARRHLEERKQDLSFRRIERMWRRIDDMRRLMDKRASALQAIASVSALIAGFEMVVLVETSFEALDVDQVALTTFAFFSTVVVTLNVLTTITASLLMIRILNFDEKKAVLHQQPVGFSRYWELRCVTEWKLCIRLFLWGFPCFFISLGLMAWMRFHPLIAAPVAVTCVSVAGIIVLLVSTGHNKGVPGFVGSSNMETAETAEAAALPTAQRNPGAEPHVAALGAAAPATHHQHQPSLSATDVEAALAIEAAAHDGKAVSEHLPELGDEYRAYVERGGAEAGHDSWAGSFTHG